MYVGNEYFPHSTILRSAFGMTGIFGLNMGTTVPAIYANI